MDERLNNLLKKFLKFGLTLVILIVAMSFYYYLPKTHKVDLIGTEVKRMDKNTEQSTQDIRFVVASDYETKETKMFRNQDMPWPPYFKFNSGDLSGKVMNLENNYADAVVLITYYGWRIPFLSMYPNVTKLEIVEPNYEHVPWFNLFFLSFLFLSIIVIIVFFKYKKKEKKKTSDQTS